MTKLTAAEEIEAEAKRVGWHVETGPVETYTTRRKGFGFTDHAYSPMFISLTDKQRAEGNVSSLYSGFTVLFDPSGNFVWAREGGPNTYDDFNKLVVSRYTSYGRQEFDTVKAGHTRYDVALSKRQKISKGDLLLRLVVEDPIYRKAQRAESDAQRAAEERNRNVAARQAAREASDKAVEESTEALEAVKEALRTSHPRLAEAPGFVDTIIWALVGAENADSIILKFLDARGDLESANARIAMYDAKLEEEVNHG